MSSRVAPGRPRHLLVVGLCLLAALLTIGASRIDSALLVAYACAAILGILAALPALRAAYDGKLDFFEGIHLYGLIYFLNFGAAALWTLHNPDHAYDLGVLPWIPLAAVYGVVGYASYLAGYYGPFRKTSTAPKSGIEVRSALPILIPGLVGFVGYLVWYAVIRADLLGLSRLTGVTSALGQLSPLFLFAWAIGWILVFSKRATRLQRNTLLFILIPLALVISRAYITDKSLIVTLAVLPTMAYWYARRTLPWRTIAVLLLVVVFVVFPIYNTVRHIDVADSVENRLGSTFEQMSRWDSTTYLERSIGEFQGRLSLINSLAVILAEVPGNKPHLWGEQIVMAPAIILIPRILWPDKPNLRVGREFGWTFRLVSPVDRTTSVAPSIPGEWYWNFGTGGVLVGMFLFGIGMRLMYERLGPKSADDPFRLAAYMVLLIEVVLTEGNIVGMIGGLLKLGILIWLLRALCLRFDLIRRVPAASP